MDRSLIGDFNDIKNHSFLASEMLIPNLNKCDSGRSFMFTSHISQFVHINEAEPPKVFTNFENQVGEYNSENIIADQDYIVLKVFMRNKYNGIAIIKGKKDKVVKSIDITPYSRFTEYFAGQIIQAKFVEDTSIKKGEYLQRSNLVDEYGNLQYGKNLKSVFLAWDNLTYEDACIISETTANKKLATTLVDEIIISVNTNNIPLNIYGTPNNYKVMPEIGAEIRDHTVMALRQLNYTSFLYDMTDENLRKVNYLNDTLFYSDGKVYDIEIFSNTELDKLNESIYNKQFVSILRNQNRYNKNVHDYIKYIIDSKQQVSDDLIAIYAKLEKILSGKKWSHNKTEFDNLIITIKVASEVTMKLGDKITGR